MKPSAPYGSFTLTLIRIFDCVGPILPLAIHPGTVNQIKNTITQPMKINPHKQTATVAVIAGFLVIQLGSVHAQIGSGWSQISPGSTIQIEVNSTITSYSGTSTSLSSYGGTFNNSGGVETFKLVPSGDPNNQAGRVERRMQDNYSSGSRQFQGDCLIYTPSDGQTIHQVFGNGTYILVRESSANNGSIKVVNGPNLATGLYGTWFRLNSINDLVNNVTTIYVNGSLKFSGTPPSGNTFYTKYGNYGTLNTSSAEIQYKNVSLYSGGNSGGGSLSGVNQLQNEKSGMALNVSGASTANGAAIIQWPYGNGSANEQWTFKATDSGYYQIVNLNSGKDVVVSGASTSQGALIIQYTFGSSQNDQWQPQLNSDGSYTFVNRRSGLVLEDPGNSTSQGTQMDQWGSNGGANQKWKLIAE